MSIKRKLLLTGLFAGTVFIGGLLLFFKGLTDLKAFASVEADIIRLSVDILSLRRDEKDFLARQDLKYVEQFQQDNKSLDAGLQRLGTALAGESAAEAELAAVREAIAAYAASFSEIVEVQKRIGLDHQSGLYGALRESVHHVEAQLEELHHHELLHDTLMLRRHEKDFMLRRDLAYVDKFKQTYQAMLAEAKADTRLADTDRQKIAGELDHYRTDFLNLVAAETDKGLTHDEGKLGEMRAVINSTEEALHKLENTANAIMDADSRFHQWLIFIVIAAGFSLAAWAIYTIIREILRQVGGEPAHIAGITEQVAGGNLEVDLGADDADVTGIYASVRKMVHSLRAVNREREEQSWLKTGQAELNEKISGEQNIGQLAENIINFLTPYVQAQVGAFYVLEGRGDDAVLCMIASHAYTWRGNLSNRFKPGEGLVGQAALEHKPIMVTELPQDHVRIETGLGQSAPSAVFIMPFLYEGELKGVLELASVHTFSTIQREFLKQIGPNIGIAVNTAESRDKMQELLAQSQAQSEELQAQTEELQAQQEELQAQQEELRQANEEMELRSRELEQGRG